MARKRRPPAYAHGGAAAVDLIQGKPYDGFAGDRKKAAETLREILQYQGHYYSDIQIDESIQHYMDETKEILLQHKDTLLAVAIALYERGTLYPADLEKILPTDAPQL